MRSMGRAALAVLVLAVVTTACSRDDEVNKTVADLQSFTDQLVAKVKAAPDPSAGVDAAQKYLDEHRAEIKGKLAAVKEVRGFQISEATKKKTEEAFTKMAQAVVSLSLENVGRAARDAGFQAKLEKLTNDYRDLIAG
jgi:Tfp pilus assembly protein PilP